MNDRNVAGEMTAAPAVHGSRSDERFEEMVRLVDRAKEEGETLGGQGGGDLAAPKPAPIRQLPGHIADQPLDRHRLLLAIEPEDARRAAGGEHVVGAGGVVAERDGAAGAQEDGAGRADPAEGHPGLGDQEQDVLGGVGFGEGQGRIQVGGDQERAAGLQGSLDHGGPRLTKKIASGGT